MTVDQLEIANAHRGRGRLAPSMAACPTSTANTSPGESSGLLTSTGKRGHLAHSDSRLSFDVIVPLEGDCEDALEAIAASMQAQTYSNWRLVLVDSGTASDAAQGVCTTPGVRRAPGVVPGAERRRRGCRPQRDACQSSADWMAFLPPGGMLCSGRACSHFSCVGHETRHPPASTRTTTASTLRAWSDGIRSSNPTGPRPVDVDELPWAFDPVSSEDCDRGRRSARRVARRGGF